MRICLHTVRELGPGFIGGTERLLIESSKELAALGHQVLIVASGMRGEIEVEGIRVLQRVPDTHVAQYIRRGFANSAFIKSEIMGGLADENALRAVGRYVDDQLQGVEADVIHMNSFAAALFAERAIGAVITSHENDLEHERVWGEGFAGWMGQLVRTGVTKLQAAKLLTAPSKHYSQYFSALFNLKVVHLSAGIGLLTFDRNRRRAAAVRLENIGLRVLLPARFDAVQKGHDTAMEACAILNQRGVPAHFTFTGVRSDYEPRLSDFYAAASHWGVSDRVVAKRYEDIHRAYDECDVVVSPERFCSYGLSISEALCLGIPTVLSDIPTYREVAEGFAHAHFFSTGNAMELADHIVQATQTPEAVRDREAVRFRVANDLRKAAIELTAVYNA